MEENNKGGYTAEGRKLRPRRPRISSNSNKAENSERQSYGERRDYGSSEHSADYGRTERKVFQRHGAERVEYGEHKRYRGNGGDSRGYRSHGSDDSRGYRGNGGDDSRGYRGRSTNQSRNFRDNSRGFRANGTDENREFRGHSSDDSRSYRSNGRYDNRGYRGKNAEENGNFEDRGSRAPKFGDRHKSGFRPKPGLYHFGESSKAGIDKMLERRPRLDQIEYSDSDIAPTEIQEEIRLNKFIANSGVCSRREADQFIQAGVVTVNGEIVTELGTKVNVLKDEVRFNDEPIRGEKKVYIVMNKPKGFVTTTSDSHAENTVMDLLKRLKIRVFPVGRLDKNTTGVLMFTNDGEIAEKLTHPSYDKKKIYQVMLQKPLSEEDFAKVTSGIELNDGPIKADALEYIDAEDHRKLGIEIHSGKNRIVRRIFESLGYDVKALDRVYFAGLTKKGLKKGEWRFLTEGEANVLKMGAYL